MKRTFLKVALLSTVLLGMPAAFTSCKDYQDDIDNINKETADLQAQINALKTALDEAKANCASACQNAANAADEAKKTAAQALQAAEQAKADAIAAAIAKCEELMKGAATQADIEKLAGQIEGIQTGLNTLTTNYDTLSSKVNQLEIQLGALEKFKELTGYDNVTAAIAAIKTDLATINSKLDGLTTSENLETAKQQLQQYCDDAIAKANITVSQISANLVTLLTTQLRSLVFIPDLYIDGIEGTTYNYVTYKVMNASNASLTVDNHNGVACNVVSPGTEWNYIAGAAAEIDPVNFVNYELNPSTALVKGEDLSFLTADKNYLATRASVDPMKVVADQVSVAGGNVKVGYTCVGSKIEKGAKVSTFALNAKVPNLEVDGKATEVGDITSDYAALYGSYTTPVALAYNANTYNAKVCPTNPELWPTLREAIQNAPTVNVQWDKTFDLKPILETHYTTNGGTAHDAWTTAQLKDLGLVYDFAPIQYTVGPNSKTSDSQFINQNLTDGIVDPCGVTVDGKADNTDTRASIDKNPIVRVRLLDTTHNNAVVLVGFIKINIVKETITPVYPADKETDAFTFGEVKFNCNGKTNELNWSEVTNKIYQLLNISKADFETKYKLSRNAAGAILQYEKGANGYSALTGSAVYGTFVEVTDPTGATTNLLKWILSMADLQRIFELNNETLTVYVLYEPLVEKETLAKVYVPLTVGPVVKDAAGTVGNKAVSAWFRNGEVNLLNVPEPSFDKNPSVLAYTYNLNNAWYSGSTTQTPGPVLLGDVASKYPNMKWYLTAANNNVTISDVVLENGTKAAVKLSVDYATAQSILGGTHNVAVANMGKHGLLVNGTNPNEYNNATLYATAGTQKEKVAVLDQNTGKITYQNNAIARALLNHYASGPKNNADRTEAQLPVNIGLAYYNSCNVALPLTNGQYNGYFLRPINIETVQGKWFQDAEANGSTIKITDLLNFYDWRFFDFVGANIWLFGYYDVQSVDVDLNGITSNYAGVWGTNPAVTAGFSYKHTANGIQYPNPLGPVSSAASVSSFKALLDAGLGEITWKNTGINVHEFQVKIPVTVNYAWGKIHTTIEATVKNTYNRK